MAMNSGTTFKKRQKEIARMEKQRDKVARRLQRKADKAAGITHDSDEDEFSASPGENPDVINPDVIIDKDTGAITLNETERGQTAAAPK